QDRPMPTRLARTRRPRLDRSVGLLWGIALVAAGCAAPAEVQGPDPLTHKTGIFAAPGDSPLTPLDVNGQEFGGPANLADVQQWRSGRQPGDLGTIIAAALPTAAAALTPGGTLIFEAVDWPGPGAAVVIFLLVEPKATGPDAVRRVAVAIATSVAGAATVSGSWPLPPPAPAASHAALLAEPVTDPALLQSAQATFAGDELLGSDLQGAQLLALARATDAWPWIAQIQDRAGATRSIWLRRDLDRFVVSGLPTPVRPNP
ncbi:MAG: hypothetical protein ACI867_001976, partial [Glaciecola sp.]